MRLAESVTRGRIVGRNVRENVIILTLIMHSTNFLSIIPPRGTPSVSS